jgi:hypothetical protein
MCYLSKKSSKYFSFCDTIFSSCGRSGRICYLPYCFTQKWKKWKKTLLHGMWKLVGTPMESVSHGLWKEKWGGVPSFIKEHKSANLSLSKTWFVWKIVRSPLPVVDKNNHLSKQIVLSVLQMKSSSTCLITTSLCEGPFFYFYVESSPSNLYAPSKRA